MFLQVKKILLRRNVATNEIQNWLVFLNRMLKESWDKIKTDIFVGNCLIIFRTSQSEMEINCETFAHILIKGKSVGKGFGMTSPRMFRKLPAILQGSVKCIPLASNFKVPIPTFISKLETCSHGDFRLSSVDIS
jgi:hypothetical protein